MNYRALSPLDGRYADRTAALGDYLSEWALMKYRVMVESRWLMALSEENDIAHVRSFTLEERELLTALFAEFDDASAEEIKSIEAETNHDVKAVEYFVKARLSKSSLADAVESVHFACTSDDINNLAYAMMFRDALSEVWQPQAAALLQGLDQLSISTAETAMVARTHGQAATPTTMGKELKVFVYRLGRQFNQIEAQEYLGKFNGAVGAYNAHVVAYPDVDWRAITRRFVLALGLSHNPLTTQIEPHDFLAELAHCLMRFNTVLLDLCRDMWAYISLGYFQQKLVAHEIGSSTMPHKVNPIDFENAEANLGISSALFTHLADKLPVSRLQRDLSDSSAMRNYGVAIAHSYLALLSATRGLARVEPDQQAMGAELADAWEVLGEAVQTILRKHQIPEAYEKLKELTRGRSIDGAMLRRFIRSLAIPDDDKKRLMRLTPATYIGYAKELALDPYSNLETQTHPATTEIKQNFDRSV